MWGRWRKGGKRKEGRSKYLMVWCTEDGGGCATEAVVHAVFGHLHTLALDDHDRKPRRLERGTEVISKIGEYGAHPFL